MARFCIEELVELAMNEDVNQTIPATEPTGFMVVDAFEERPVLTAAFGFAKIRHIALFPSE